MIANERFTVTPALTQDTRTVAINGFICCWSGVRMQQYVFYGNKCHANNTEIGGAILWQHRILERYTVGTHSNQNHFSNQ